MTRTTPRIATVRVAPPSALLIDWTNGGVDHVELAGWIATGGDVLAALRDRAVFASAHPIEFGSAVGFGDDDDDDLAIDAIHLQKIAAEQLPFSGGDLAAWQAVERLSNNEAADLLGIGLSTFNAYKAGTSKIPDVVAIACRAISRDPTIKHAHLKPRKAGRPRKTA